MLGNTATLGLGSNHEAGDVLQKQQRYSALVGQFDEMRALQGRLGQQRAVVGEDGDRLAVDRAKAGHQRISPQRFELVESAAVEQPRNDFARVVGLFGVDRYDAIELNRVVTWCAGRQRRHHGRLGRQAGDDLTQHGQRLVLVLGQVVADPGDTAVHLRAAQGFAVDYFVDRDLDDGRATQMDAGVTAHHHHFVRQRGNVGAARGAAAEHGRELRQAGLRHAALAVEAVAEVVLVGKHAVLLRQKGTAAVHQVQAGQSQALGDFLRPHVFLDGFMEERAALDGGVVGDEHARPPGHHADAGDDARTRHLVAILIPGRQRREFQEGAAVIDDEVDALAHQQLAARVVAPDVRITPASGHPGQACAQGLDLGAAVRQRLVVGIAAGVDTAF